MKKTLFISVLILAFIPMNAISNDKSAESLLKIINKINKSSPSTISASFYLQGKIKNSKFKTIGHGKIDKQKRKLYLKFSDYVFKTPIVYIFQDRDVVKLYFSIDKKIFVDNYNTLSLKNYSNIDMDFKLFYTLFTGSIPLIENYKVKKSGILKKGNRDYLIIENDKMYQNIIFKNDIPEKILFMNKKTKSKTEIYIKKYMKKGNISFIKKVKLVVKKSSLRLTLSFSRIKLNKKVNVRTIDKMRISKKVKTYYVRGR